MSEILLRELKKHFHNADYSPVSSQKETIWKCLCGAEYISSAQSGVSIIEAYQNHVEERLLEILNVGEYNI